jgi:hypothetical protein
MSCCDEPERPTHWWEEVKANNRRYQFPNRRFAEQYLMRSVEEMSNEEINIWRALSWKKHQEDGR